MYLKIRESLSCNLMTRAASFQNCTKTNHDSIYSEKITNFLVVNCAHGSNIRRIHERHGIR